MLTVKQLDEMSRLGADKIDRTKLVDICEIKIDNSLPSEQRMKKYLEQVKNPYCFLCGDSVVRVRFDSKGGSLKNKLRKYFISVKKV